MKNKFTILFLLFLSSLGISAQDIPEPMRPYRLVNDFANVFSSAENQALEQRLLAYNDSTSTQIYVVTVNDLGGYPASDYAFVLGEKWEIGQKGKDNGLLILIKPKVGNSRGQAFIATGYGLEGSINDAFAGRIVRDRMIPYFQEDDYFGGVNAAVDVVIARLSGEFDPDAEESGGGLPVWAIILLVVVFFILFSVISSGGDQHIDGRGHHRTGGGPIFFPPVSRGRGSGWGGGGFGGGGSFGGFGGGGGGSFGGGGAGGSW
ncbi:MAG: TPM domain-containing protein [Bacteroidia bacterium]|nr:TPM domain-containing protein [Bacteroidia bacterium]